MYVKRDIYLKDFEFWCGAKDTVKYLDDEDFLQLEQLFEELYPEGIDETLLNDIFWFEEDFLAEMLGYESFEDWMENKKNACWVSTEDLSSRKGGRRTQLEFNQKLWELLQRFYWKSWDDWYITNQQRACELLYLNSKKQKSKHCKYQSLHCTGQSVYLLAC